MLDPEFLKWLASLGVGGILAAIFYYQNTKNAQDYANQLKELLIQERGRTDLLLTVIRDNTKAITENTTITRSFHHRLDETEGER